MKFFGLYLKIYVSFKVTRSNYFNRIFSRLLLRLYFFLLNIIDKATKNALSLRKKTSSEHGPVWLMVKSQPSSLARKQWANGWKRSTQQRRKGVSRWCCEELKGAKTCNDDFFVPKIAPHGNKMAGVVRFILHCRIRLGILDKCVDL